MANTAPGATVRDGWVRIYSPEHEICEGTPLDDAELERMASWLHQRAIWCELLRESSEERNQAREQGDARGFCDECERMAGFLLSECPYIDMSRPDQLAFTAHGMEWRPRSASIPNNRICTPIDEKQGSEIILGR